MRLVKISVTESGSVVRLLIGLSVVISVVVVIGGQWSLSVSVPLMMTMIVSVSFSFSVSVSGFPLTNDTTGSS